MRRYILAGAMLCSREYLPVQMQRTYETLFTGIILCFRYLTFQRQSTNATIFPGFTLCFREYPLPVSKCKVQMRHYLLGFFHAFDNPPFPNARNKCDIIYWSYFMLETIPPSFQIQRPNLTFFTRSIKCNGKDFLL